jgi:hypothetical protein
LSDSSSASLFWLLREMSSTSFLSLRSGIEVARLSAPDRYAELWSESCTLSRRITFLIEIPARLMELEVTFSGVTYPAGLDSNIWDNLRLIGTSWWWCPSVPVSHSDFEGTINAVALEVPDFLGAR